MGLSTGTSANLNTTLAGERLAQYGGVMATVSECGPAIRVPPGSVNFPLGTSGNGGKGNRIIMLHYFVTDAANATVTIKDGSGQPYADGTANPFNDFVLLNAAMITAGAPMVRDFRGQPSFDGTYTMTTGTGVTVLAIGIYGPPPA
jgi:hypothetical protein